MSKNDPKNEPQDHQIPETDEPIPAKEPTPEPKKGKRRPKDQAQSVSVKLDPATRQKLLNINSVHSKQARIALPLSASTTYAIEIAHEALFGEEYNDLPQDVNLP